MAHLKGRMARKTHKKKPITRKKARLILSEGEVRGHRLTEKQRKFMGARSSGYPATKTSSTRKRKDSAT